MDNIILGAFVLLSFGIGYVYLFQPDLAAKWDNSRRQVLGQDDVERNALWRNRARLRGVMSVAVGVLLLAIMLRLI